jgi:hypothetical protein
MRTLRESYPDLADDPDEELVADVRKHWIGHLAIWATGIFAALLLISLTFATLMFAKGSGYALDAGMLSLLSLIVLVVAILIIFATVIADWVYGKSHMLITNENIIEMRQISLFSTKTSHLNMINIEDVSVRKKGILQTLLNYGTLNVQTAGELENFNFTNAPTPDSYRRYIIQAHEAAVAKTAQMGPMQRVEVARNNL